jgi:hypothetical protein
MRMTPELGARGALLLVLSTSLSAHAASADKGLPPQPVFGVAALGDAAGAGLALEGRLRIASGVQLGLGVASQALRVAHMGGYAVRGVSRNEAQLLALFPLLEIQGFELDLRVATGLVYLHDVGALESPYRHALRSSTEVACLAHVRLGDHNVLRAGVRLGFDLETEPTTSLADQAQLLSVGFGRALTASTLLYASLDGGGTYGFNGDNAKAVLRGSLGLRFTLGGDARMAF